MKKESKRIWSEPKLVVIETVSETAAGCASGNADVLTCSTGNSAFQCTAGNIATF